MSEAEIRTLVEKWADAVHTGKLDTVVSHHTDDLVMFDVPPPDDGVRGLEAYAKIWPGFFEWQANGSTFEILELKVEAGEDVAFAWALLKCGTEEEYEKNPERRLRLSLGLRKEDGTWKIAHEHHSFPHGD